MYLNVYDDKDSGDKSGIICFACDIRKTTALTIQWSYFLYINKQLLSSVTPMKIN